MFLHVIEEAAQAIFGFQGHTAHLHTSHAASVHCIHTTRLLKLLLLLLREASRHHGVSASHRCGASAWHHAAWLLLLLSHWVLHHHLHHAHHAIHLFLHLLHLHRVLLRRHTARLQTHLLHPLLHHLHVLLHHGHLLTVLRLGLSRHATHLACSTHWVHSWHCAGLSLSWVLLLVFGEQFLERII